MTVTIVPDNPDFFVIHAHPGETQLQSLQPGIDHPMAHRR
jgi:hypothetical protein